MAKDVLHVGMSYAFRQSGYVAGFFLLGTVAVLTRKQQ